MNPETFYNILHSNEKLVLFLRQLNVLPQKNSLICNKCLIPMADKFKKRKDGDCNFLFRCHKCSNEISMLKTLFWYQRS